MIDRDDLIPKEVYEQASPLIRENADRFLPKLQDFEEKSEFKFRFTSTYRTIERQKEIYREKNIKRKEAGLKELNTPLGSAHLVARAADIYDPLKTLQKWCLANEEYLKESGLCCEAFHTTPDWVHVQDRPVPSGKTFFEPY